MHAPELGNRLVIRRQPSQQPHQLNVPSALRFQSPGGTVLLQIPVQVKLQQIAWIITRPPSLGRLGALKSQTRHVQPTDKCIDDPAHMISEINSSKVTGKRVPCVRPSPRTKPMRKCPRFHEGIFSFIFGRSTEFRSSLPLE